MSSKNMMKVHVDISLYTERSAFGRISGFIQVSLIPQVGDSISFSFPNGGSDPDEKLVFSGLTKVIDRTIWANREENVSISLSDIVVKTIDDAERVIKFFETYYYLHGESYSGED